jgi:hypothetical protein
MMRIEIKLTVKNDDLDANFHSRKKYATDMAADQTDSKTC